MIRVPRERKVWVRSCPTDLRRGFAGLAALVEREMGHDLVVGDLFVFISRDRRLLKLLAWDGSGLILYTKRLARGKFAEVWRHRRGERIGLSRAALHELLRGADITVSAGWRTQKNL